MYFLSSKEGYARVGVKVVGENKYYEDSDGDKAVIPAGFAIVPGCSDVSSGLVISDVENDTSDSGNEFVWIPCTIDGSNDTIPYERHDFGKNNLNYGFHSETLSEDESNSIKNNGGFYIGRYETGTTVQRTEETTELGTIFIKKNLFPYTCITSLQDCKDLSASMAANNGYNGITKLCSSYAWDTALRYIEKVTGTSYATSSTQGNYSDQNKSKYIDESGEEKGLGHYGGDPGLVNVLDKVFRFVRHKHDGRILDPGHLPDLLRDLPVSHILNIAVYEEQVKTPIFHIGLLDQL